MAEHQRRVRVGRHAFDATHLDRILFPDATITKGEFVDHMRAVAPAMLPHVRGRALTVQRFPRGIGAQGFFQQARPEGFPDWVGAIAARRVQDGRRMAHVACANEASIAYLANQNVLTLHRWLSRQRALARPDLLVFDLDPSGDDFAPVRRTAHRVREALDEAGLAAGVMSTGGRGLHVVAPLRPVLGFEDVRALARGLAAALAHRYPDELTTEQRRRSRQGRLFLDVARNAYGQTIVAPYSARARPGAPVAVPLAWDEVDRFEPGDLHLRNVPRRLARKGDPWSDLHRHARDPRRAAARVREGASSD